jgi:K+-transporting ATPase ATPase C chain
MQPIIASLRLVATTLLVCVGGYTLVILGVAQVLTLRTAQGSLIETPDGRVIGSRLIAQKFTRPDYFWPRPSAADYNAGAAAGSNKSPTSSDLTARAEELIVAYGASEDRPLPADLVAASGAGLDPHISLAAALYQAPRVAAARALDVSRVEDLVRKHAVSPGGPFTGDRVVNVLELNLALDELAGAPAAGSP